MVVSYAVVISLLGDTWGLVVFIAVVIGLGFALVAWLQASDEIDGRPRGW
jgi:hypothetical protein